MIKRLLRNIRQKPKGTRDAIAFSGALVFSLMIFTVWVFNTPARMAAIQDTYSTENKTDGFGSLFGGVKDQLAAVVESMSVATTTDSVVETRVANDLSTTTATSSIIIPSVEETSAMIKQNLASSSVQIEMSSSSSLPAATETVENNSSGGREVRIITTQSASSASQLTP